MSAIVWTFGHHECECDEGSFSFSVVIFVYVEEGYYPSELKHWHCAGVYYMLKITS